MYSRYSNRPDRPIRLPEHYSGCAFANHPSIEPHHPSVARPSPPPQTERFETTAESTAIPLHESVQEQAKDFPKNDCECNLEKQMNNETVAKPSPSPMAEFLSDTADFDRILLIALILLLSHTKENSDMMLWLLLLLICG